MLQTLKPTATFATRDEAGQNAIMLFPDERAFREYVTLRESKNGLELDSETKRRLNLEEVFWTTGAPEAITAALDSHDAEADELKISSEGRAFFAYHRMRERDPGLRDAVIARKGRSCEICAMSFRDTYGHEVADFIEVHHLRGLSEGERDSRVDDFAVVCANCHRAVHYGQSLPRTLAAVRAMHELRART